MSSTDRIKKWRERRAAEGKKTFTVLLSIEAQQIINSEKEKTGDSYSDILERALKTLTGGNNHEISRSVSRLSHRSDSEIPAVAAANGVSRTGILIDDLANYEFTDDRTDLNYKKGADYPAWNRKESFLKKLVKIPGKKNWFT
jgi:hypothetical protein